MLAAMVLSLSIGLGQAEAVSFPAGDAATIHGTIYGGGVRGIVLAHGGRYDATGWAPQARRLAEAGFVVLAFDFRGTGRSPASGAGALTTQDAGRHHDVLGAVRYLRSRGATTVAVIGASMGGDYAAEAAERELLSFLSESGSPCGASQHRPHPSCPAAPAPTYFLSTIQMSASDRCAP
jgi:dipeptidyl aminopeptidase/acylaminoacyl peptidase